MTVSPIVRRCQHGKWLFIIPSKNEYGFWILTDLLGCRDLCEGGLFYGCPIVREGDPEMLREVVRHWVERRRKIAKRKGRCWLCGYHPRTKKERPLSI